MNFLEGKVKMEKINRARAQTYRISRRSKTTHPPKMNTLRSAAILAAPPRLAPRTCGGPTFRVTRPEAFRAALRTGLRTGLQTIASVALWAWVLLAPKLAFADDPPVKVSELKSDEQLVFFPTSGVLDEAANEWVVPIHGWIFEPEGESLTRRLLLEQVEALLSGKLDEDARAILRRRLGLFLVDNERGKRITIRIAGKLLELPPSGPDGHFEFTARIPVADANSVARRGRLEFTAHLASDDERRVVGVAHLSEPTGLTIVSDIDDTVKITEVRDKRLLLENTLARPFRAVPGMADVYRKWLAADERTRLVWVSSSPWQLYEPLAELFVVEKFPDAVWQLRSFRISPTGLANLLADPEESKVTRISQLIEQYPQRRFALVGDSGERDPEVYGRIAGRFPDQIERIFIRDVTNEAIDSPRYAACWKEVRPGVATIFRDASELPAQLPAPPRPSK